MSVGKKHIPGGVWCDDALCGRTIPVEDQDIYVDCLDKAIKKYGPQATCLRCLDSAIKTRQEEIDLMFKKMDALVKEREQLEARRKGMAVIR